jgi:hypothetical protein
MMGLKLMNDKQLSEIEFWYQYQDSDEAKIIMKLVQYIKELKKKD